MSIRSRKICFRGVDSGRCVRLAISPSSVSRLYFYISKHSNLYIYYLRQYFIICKFKFFKHAYSKTSNQICSFHVFYCPPLLQSFSTYCKIILENVCFPSLNIFLWYSTVLYRMMFAFSSSLIGFWYRLFLYKWSSPNGLNFSCFN
jgi:hypothetical protein